MKSERQILNEVIANSIVQSVWDDYGFKDWQNVLPPAAIKLALVLLDNGVDEFRIKTLLSDFVECIQE